MATHTVTLASETDWPGFRSEARALLARQVPPEDVEWHTKASAEIDLFASLDARRPAVGPGSASAVVPPAFVRLCETVVLHHDPARFGLTFDGRMGRLKYATAHLVLTRRSTSR